MQQTTAVAGGSSSVSETLGMIAAIGPIFAGQIESVFGTTIEELGWNGNERQLTSTLIQKYQSNEWTRRT